MSAATLPAAAAAHLAALERELADLPADERAELLEEIEASLLAAGDDPEATLGTPARFAAELRASAGLAPAPAIAAAPRESAWTRLKRDPAFRSALATARELEPIWWAARAYIVLAAFTVGTREVYAVPFPRLSGYPALDVVLVALVVAVSIALGLVDRRPVETRTGRVVFNAFPIRYFEPGTRKVTHPNAVPHGMKPKPLR
jgi:hypothetical protein